MKTSTNVLDSTGRVFRQYKKLAENAMAQLSDNDLLYVPGEGSNSIAIIIQHLSGNMLSRWTDFLSSDGEKSWRKRDAEFEPGLTNRDELMHAWEAGWACLLDTLDSLTENDLQKIITIRSEENSVLEAINRQVAHYSYHTGQIVFIAKMIRGNDWNTLSVAKGGSAEFNRSMKHQ